MKGGGPSEHDRLGNTAVTSFTAMQAVLAATFIALCPPVQAQSASQEPAHGFSGRIGPGVATLPNHEGSPNRRTLAGPAAAVQSGRSAGGECNALLRAAGRC